MKKRMGTGKTLLCCIVLLLVLWGRETPVQAAETGDGASMLSEIYEKSGASDLYRELDDETRKRLSDAGVQEGAVSGVKREGLLGVLSDTLREKLHAPLKTLAAVLAILILVRICESMEGDGISKTAGLVAVAAAISTLLPAVLGLLQTVERVVKAGMVFLGSCVPVYAGLMIAGGRMKTGAAYGATTLFVGNAIPVLFHVVVLPLLHVALAFSLVGALAQGGLEKTTAGIHQFIKWAMILLTTVFLAVMSIQTAIGTATDAVTEKTVKLVASSAIPVVGGVLGDSYAAIQSCVGLIQSGVGAFGLLAALMLFLPVLIETAVWAGVTWIAGILADLMGSARLGRLFAGFNGVIKILLGVLACVAVVCVVCAAVVIYSRAG